MVVEPIITNDSVVYVKPLDVDADNLPICVVTKTIKI